MTTNLSGQSVRCASQRLARWTIEMCLDTRNLHIELANILCGGQFNSRQQLADQPITTVE